MLPNCGVKKRIPTSVCFCPPPPPARRPNLWPCCKMCNATSAKRRTAAPTLQEISRWYSETPPDPRHVWALGASSAPRSASRAGGRCGAAVPARRTPGGAPAPGRATADAPGRLTRERDPPVVSTRGGGGQNTRFCENRWGLSPEAQSSFGLFQSSDVFAAIKSRGCPGPPHPAPSHQTTPVAPTFVQSRAL